MKKIFLATLFLFISILNTNAQLSSAYTNRLQFVLDSVCNKFNIKGASAALLVPNIGIWKGTHGESYAGDPITSDMLFGIGSNTKTHISALMLRLQELGYVNISDTIGTWIQNQPNISGQITIQQLLNHTSGLYSFTDTSVFWDSVFNDPAHVWQPEQALQFVSTPYFAPGTSWHYSNTNYLLAGLIIKQIMGQPLSLSLQNYLLTPVGLSNTIFFPEQNSSAPMPHIWSTWFGAGNLEDVMATYGYSNNSLFSLAYGAGAIMQTAEDNAQFWHKLISGQIIDTSSLNEMMQFIPIGISLGHPVGYGLGIFRYENFFSGHTIYEHGGTNMGFINENLIDSVTGTTISVLTNQDSINNDILFLDVVAALHKVSQQMSPTDIQEILGTQMGIHIYPNPASGILNVDIANNSAPIQLSLYDIVGRNIVNKEMTTSQKLDISRFTPGMYLLKMTSNGNMVYSATVRIN